MTFRIPDLASCLALLLAPTLALTPEGLTAQAPDSLRQDTVYEVEPISVRAVRPVTTSGGVSAIMVHLDSIRFRPAPLLEHILRELPLVQVRTNSRGEAQLALRGADERQIAILLDGVPLTLGWDHRTDLSVIPMTAAQTVRLVRGMSSVLHGPNVLGGVVEIGMGSAPAVRVEPLQAALGIDQIGGYSASMASGARLDAGAGELVVRGGAGRRQHHGLPAAQDLETLYPGLNDGARRANSDLAHTDGFFSARFTPRRGAWVSALVSAFEAERGVPPELDSDDPRLWRYPETSRMVGILSGGADALENDLGTASVDLNFGVDLGSTLIHDFDLPESPDDPTLPAEAFFRELSETERSDDRTLTLRGRVRQAVGDARLAAAATIADIRHDEVITVGMAGDSPAEEPGSYQQRLWSVGAEVDLPVAFQTGAFTGGRVSGGFVWDGAAIPEAGPTRAGPGPSLGDWGARIGLTASTTERLLLHTALSRRGRFPALREMYSTALGRFEPNPALRPEVLTAVEAGLTTRFGRYDIQMVGFHQRLDDAIARGAPPVTSTARYMRVNRDRIRSTGLEVMAGYSMGRVTFESEATLQSVKVVEPGHERIRAEYEPTLAGGFGATMPLIAGIEATAEVRYRGEQFCATPSPGTEEFRALEPSARADLQLARRFRFIRGAATFDRMDVELAVDNVTDSTVYDQCGLPQPGRAFRLQVRLN